MQLGGTILDSDRQDAMIDKDEYIKSLEISVQLLQREIESLRTRLVESSPSDKANKKISISNYIHKFLVAKTNAELNEILNDEISDIDGLLEAELFHFNREGFIASFLDDEDFSQLYHEVKEMEASGVMDWLISQEIFKLIPSLNSASDKSQMNFIIYPIINKGTVSTLFIAKTSLKEEDVYPELEEIIKIIAESAAISIDNLISAEEIRRINKQLSKNSNANQDQSKHEIIKTTLGEILDPINIIKANLSLIKTGIGDVPRRVDISEEELEKISTLTGKLFQLISNDNTGEFSVKDIITEITLISKSQLRRDGIRIDVNLDESDKLLNIKRIDLEKILLNLILCSRDMMPDGGIINVSYSLSEFDDLSITINNDGIGFSKDEINELLSSADSNLTPSNVFRNFQNSQRLAKDNGIEFELISDTNTGTSYKLFLKNRN